MCIMDQSLSLDHSEVSLMSYTEWDMRQRHLLARLLITDIRGVSD